MKTILNKIKQNSGLSVIALTSTILLLLVLSLTATTLLAIRAETSSDDLNSKRALYVAEAGLEMAKHTLQNDWASAQIAENFPLTSFAGGTFDSAVSQTADANQVVISVMGNYGNSTRAISSLVSRFSPPNLENAIHASGSVTLQGNSEVHNGNIAYGDNFSSSGKSSIDGEAYQTSETIPVLDVASAIAAARANSLNGYASRTDGNYFQGDITGNPNALNGIIFIDSFPDGSPADVHISGNLSTNNNNPAMFVVMGDLHISGNVDFDGLIYTTGTTDLDVLLTGNLLITGAIMTSGSLRMSGNTDITYNSNMLNDLNMLSLLNGEEKPFEATWVEISPIWLFLKLSG